MRWSEVMSLDVVIIHARFAPNGTVVEIGERPAALTPQEWFNYLADNAGDHYQALAGGRGVFRIAKADVEGFKASSIKAA